MTKNDPALFESLSSDELLPPYCSQCGEPIDECPGHSEPKTDNQFSEEELPW